jgi:hypothetical protein
MLTGIGFSGLGSGRGRRRLGGSDGSGTNRRRSRGRNRGRGATGVGGVVAEAGRRSRLRRGKDGSGPLSCVVFIVADSGSTICRAILPDAVVARRVLWRTRAEVASLGVAVESRMGHSRRWPPGS